MRDDERMLLSMCRPDVTLRSGFKDHPMFDAAARCIDAGWLAFVKDEREAIDGPGRPQALMVQSVYRITPKGAEALKQS